MPKIRIEWVPVQAFGLGFFGFDHLQLVFQQDAGDSGLGQDEWYVMEGVREADGDAAFLGIEGADGRTSLAAANLAARDGLVAKIGTPDDRGSRPLPYDGNELQAWETMASVARDIEQQDFPYVAYGPPGSPVPTINSSSAVASLIHYSGLDPSALLSFGMHRSPGTATLLGTGGDDAMRVVHGFTTLLGGDGRDVFVGGADPIPIEKYYGGGDDDLFHWSFGFNIIHGGQPQLGYEADGTDVIDSGAGTVTIVFNRHWVPHKVPHYVATFDAGLDHLFSVERIQWNAASDRIVLGKGVGLVEDDVILAPGVGDSANERTPPEPSQTRSGRLIIEQQQPSLQLGDAADNVIKGTAGDDTLYGGGGNDRLVGGTGSDGYVYLPGDGDDAIVDDGSGSDIDQLVLTGGIAAADATAQRAARDLVLMLHGGSVRIVDFFALPASGIERVVFDRDPTWTREDLLKLAAAEALLDDDVLTFVPELAGARAMPDATALDSAPATGPSDAGACVLDAPLCSGTCGHEHWLF